MEDSGFIRFLIVGLIMSTVSVNLVSSSKFDDLFQPSWSLDHVVYEGEQLKLKLDHYSGNNNNKYSF